MLKTNVNNEYLNYLINIMDKLTSLTRRKSLRSSCLIYTNIVFNNSVLSCIICHDGSILDLYMCI